MVTLHIRNAFNFAPWSLIDTALGQRRTPLYLKRIIKLYLSRRTLTVSQDGTPVRRVMVCCVPQGLVLEPALWNIYYDDLLRLELLPGAITIGFADDVAIFVTAHISALIVNVAKAVLAIITVWLTKNGLSLAAGKTEAVMVTNK